MRNRTLRALLGISALALTLGGSAAPASATPPAINVPPPSNVGAYSATLNGSVYVPWFSEQTRLTGYQYGPTSSYGFETPTTFVHEEYGWVQVPETIEGLAPETTYHYKFGAMNENAEISESGDLTFTTSSLPRFEAASYPANLKAVQQASSKLSVGVEAGSLTCSSITGTGSIGSTAQKVTLTPTFSECQALGLSATVTTNGCTLKVVAGDPGTWTAKLEVACPEGKAIQVAAGTCKFEIPAQVNAKPAKTSRNTSTEPDSIDVQYNVSNLTYTKTNDGILCPFKGTGTKEDGTLTGGQSLTATNGSGTPILLDIGY